MSDDELLEAARDCVRSVTQLAPMMSDEELMEAARDFNGRGMQTQVIVDAVVDAVDDKMQVMLDAVVDAIDNKIQAGAFVLYTKIGDEFDVVHRRLTHAGDQVDDVLRRVNHTNAEVYGLRDQFDQVKLVGTIGLVLLCFGLVGVMNMQALTMLMVFKDGQSLSFEEQRPGEQVVTDRVLTNRSDVEVICDGCIYVMQMVGGYLVKDLFME